ncbi:MAG: NHLP bacteriocin system secretion protein [Polyangiaceae bacterium]|nr:NHLP bacteriocin system secretion protein [Polyangiaceae bacterium]
MAENDARKVFRQAALDRLMSPEQLHTLMRVTDAKGWLALAGCALIIATAIVWGIFGSIQTKVAGVGILLGEEGLTEVVAAGEGTISAVEVEAGDEIKKGDVVARIAQPAVVEQIDGLKRRIAELDQNADAGTVTAGQAAYRTRLVGDLERLERQLREAATLESPIDGYVVEVRAAAGDPVVAGRPIVALERATAKQRSLEALLYFDSYTGKTLEPGMRIELSPSVGRKERHGVMIGQVKSVEEFPSTRAGMMGALRNEQLVETFLQQAGGVPIAVRAEILRDANTPTGYKWSSGAGPTLRLTSGTRCDGAVITRTQRPIALVFPALDFGG